MVGQEVVSKSGWISILDARPPEGETVWLYTKYGFTVDTWDIIYERPVEFSTKTIPVGVGFEEHDFEDVIAWKYIDKDGLSEIESEYSRYWGGVNEDPMGGL